MIKLTDLNKSFGNKHVIKDLSMQLQDGTVTGFIGPNGAGKTTTLRMMTGILTPDSGTIDINGYDLKLDSIQAKNEFAYVSDSPDSFLNLKGIKYLNLIANIYGVSQSDRVERLRTLAEDFEMQAALNDKIENYSHGMRQKIHLMAALIHDPKVWILDEPMTGLDPQSSYLLKKKMKEHAAAGNIVLFSTHVLEVAEKLCDQVIIIDKGDIRFSGRLEELKSQFPDKSLEEIFLTITNSRVIREKEVE